MALRDIKKKVLSLHLIMMFKLIILPIISEVNAQELAEMEYEEIAASGVIVADPETAVLIVQSTIADLQFNSRRGIKKVREVERGKWELLLDPGVHYVEIRREGYLTLRLDRMNYARKEGKKIVVRKKQNNLERDRPEVILKYETTSEKVYLQIDDGAPILMDITSGLLSVRTSSGNHTFKVYDGSKVWSETVDLESGNTYELFPEPVETSVERLEFKTPGNLSVDSSPQGALVYLNGVLQSGVTPISIYDLQPGNYNVEIQLEQYLPYTELVAVKESSFETINAEDAKLEPNFGLVSIQSEPAAAIVFINDLQVGKSPYQGRLSVGQHRVRLIQDKYYEKLDTINVTREARIDKRYVLDPRFGNIRIESYPSGVEISVDGVVKGKTPLQLSEMLSLTNYRISASMPPYADQTKVVRLADGEEKNVTFDLRESVGYLTLNSTLSNVTVRNSETNESLGSLPISNLPIKPGSFTFRFEKENYVSESKLFVIGAGEQVNDRVELQRKTGKLRIESQPLGAQILVDGERVGDTPSVVDLPTGMREIELVKGGYVDEDTSISIEFNKLSDWNKKLISVAERDRLEKEEKERYQASMVYKNASREKGRRFQTSLIWGAIPLVGNAMYDKDYEPGRSNRMACLMGNEVLVLSTYAYWRFKRSEYVDFYGYDYDGDTRVNYPRSRGDAWSTRLNQIYAHAKNAEDATDMQKILRLYEERAHEYGRHHDWKMYAIDRLVGRFLIGTASFRLLDSLWGRGGPIYTGSGEKKSEKILRAMMPLLGSSLGTNSSFKGKGRRGGAYLFAWAGLLGSAMYNYHKLDSATQDYDWGSGGDYYLPNLQLTWGFLKYSLNNVTEATLESGFVAITLEDGTNYLMYEDGWSRGEGKKYLTEEKPAEVSRSRKYQKRLYRDLKLMGILHSIQVIDALFTAKSSYRPRVVSQNTLDIRPYMQLGLDTQSVGLKWIF